MEMFLRCRAEEIAAGGLILITMAVVLDTHNQHRVAVLLTFIESILVDMVKEGVLSQERVDSFNIPVVLPRIEDIRRLVEKNGCFEIVKMEMVEAESATDGETETAVMHLRAGLEGTLTNHFGNEIVEQVFVRAMQHQQKLHFSRTNTSTTAVFAVLKRN
ncbi:gibberellin A4 carboxyl methyltransferase [Salvia divinorum]|uniref:Gibberellin A4 carboxyl methyltransferase n=1 Tax=Salvia divinorum TaxID=28513 RepID=A0ABD1GIP2_SALDI